MEQEKLVDENISDKIITESDFEYDADYSDYVFISGCFDILHRGHLRLLFEAEKFGQVFVGVNSDESVNKNKGKFPVLDENSRLAIVASLECVSCVYLMNEADAREVVKKIKPKMWMLGDDHKNEDFSDMPCPVAFVPRKDEPYSSKRFKEIAGGN